MTVRPPLRRTTRALAATGAACLALSALAAPAAAAPPDRSSSTRSGVSAYVDWTEVDRANALRLPGNTHVGFLEVQEGAFGTFAYGGITDWACDPGETPGGHEGPGTCELRQERSLYGDAVDLVVDGRTARLTGEIVVTNGGHGEPGSVLARVPANVVWTSSVDLLRFRGSNSYTEGGVTYRSQVRGLTSKVATTAVSGTLGRMGFADDTDDVSRGEFRTFTETFRERMR